MTNRSRLVYHSRYIRDRTGAGDAFCAGFTAAIMKGLTIDRACTYAGICGSLACETYGGLISMPRLEIITQRLSKTSSLPD